jgi:16S rRNA (cytidine1402-2'-O)-methyltransferase
VSAGPPSAGLVVCPTPIGNLGDITVRALQLLASADLIACEDTRRTGKLLGAFGIKPPPLRSLHDHNERSRLPGLLALLRSGATIALVSDAGMPLVSDPGYRLVRACISEQVAVHVLPGPSAPITALVVSGLPPAQFCFLGFLPRTRAARARALAAERRTVVAFESPERIATTLADLATFDPERQVVICRELTKLHEEVIRGSAAQLAVALEGRSLRGEIVIVLGPAQEHQQSAGGAPEQSLERIRTGGRGARL